MDVLTGWIAVGAVVAAYPVAVANGVGMVVATVCAFFVPATTFIW